MVNRIAILGVLLSLAAFQSCTQENPEVFQPAPHSKILNTRAAGQKGPDELLVKFSVVPDEQTLASLKAGGVASIERLFPSVKGKEELEARFGMDRWYVVNMENGREINAAANFIAESRSVSAVEYSVQYVSASDKVSIPAAASSAIGGTGFNDPMLSQQWNYTNTGSTDICASAYRGADINVKRVWEELTTGDSDLIVAVVDEGVKYTHPDLAANIWSNPKETADGTDSDGNGYVDDLHGYNFVDNGPITWALTDDTGHATHIAGTIAAVNNNSAGVCGIAGGSGKGDGVKIMSCQIFSGGGGGTSSIVSRAIKYAADNGASIINCSFGVNAGAFMSDGAYASGDKVAEIEALKYFEATKNYSSLDGGIAVFAAGNEGRPYAAYPGALNDIVCVSSFGPDFLPAFYTNYGPGCNIVAPGGEYGLKPGSVKSMILSTMPSELNEGSDYGYMNGTSMACPHVSGIVALGLVYAKRLGKTFSVRRFKEMLLASANDFETRLSSGMKDYAAGFSDGIKNLAPYRNKMGTGAVDAWRMMMKIEGTPCLTASVGANQWLDLSSYFGSSSVNLTYLDVECSKEDYDAVGLQQDPYVKYGMLYIHPTKTGTIRLKVNAIGGGTAVGGNDAIGGMAISQEVSVIVRPEKSEKGGWL